jgi:hypothetical protein
MVTPYCAHPGCIHALHPGNVSGVCRDHMHGPACRCAVCTAPRTAKGKRRRNRLHLRSRAELQRLGLLPGKPPDEEPPLPIPVPA